MNHNSIIDRLRRDIEDQAKVLSKRNDMIEIQDTVFRELCDELQCDYDNEAALSAIHNLKTDRATLRAQVEQMRKTLAEVERERDEAEIEHRKNNHDEVCAERDIRHREAIRAQQNNVERVRERNEAIARAEIAEAKVDALHAQVEQMREGLERIKVAGTRQETDRVGDMYDPVGGYKDYEVISEEAEIAAEVLEALSAAPSTPSKKDGR